MAMFRSLNKVMIMGNVGGEPEFKAYGDGKELARFSVAMTESWRNKKTGEWENQTEWANVVVFNEFLVETVRRHVAKGTLVYIEGAMKTRKYQKEGESSMRYSTDIVLNNFGGEIKILERAADVEARDEPEDGEEELNDDIPW